MAGADRLHRGGRQLPGEEPHRPGPAGQDAVDTQTDDGAEHRPRPARRRPHRQRQHGHAARRPGAADADVPAAPARHDVPERRPVRADRRRRRGRHRLPRVHPRPVQPARRQRHRPVHARRRRRPARWARPGATGTRWTTSSTRGCSRTGPSKVDVILFQFDGAGVALDRTEPIDCPVGVHGGSLQRRRHRSRAAATPTATTARSSAAPRCTRRRDLGADPVGPARRARLADHRVAGDPGHGALAARTRRSSTAQRDPDRRHRRLRRPAPRTRIWKVFAAPRHGLLRRLARAATTPAPGARLRHAAGHVARPAVITGTVTDPGTGTPVAGRRSSPSPSRAAGAS